MHPLYNVHASQLSAGTKNGRLDRQAVALLSLSALGNRAAQLQHLTVCEPPPLSQPNQPLAACSRFSRAAAAAARFLSRSTCRQVRTVSQHNRRQPANSRWLQPSIICTHWITQASLYETQIGWLWTLSAVAHIGMYITHEQTLSPALITQP